MNMFFKIPYNKFSGSLRCASEVKAHCIIAWRLLIVGFGFLLFFSNFGFASADNVTTNVRIAICGDGIVMDGEVCDQGVGNNTGAYASSTAERHCNPDCFGWGPYCGDIILQVLHEEECDDGNNTSNDFCSADCKEEDQGGSPSGGGSTPRGSIPGAGGIQGSIPSINQTKVVIKGKAYPNSSVNVLEDGEVVGVVKADTNADFVFSTTNITPGTATFGFWAEDKKGLRSISFTTTFEVIHSAVTTVSGVFVPPTIDLSDKQLKAGELLTVSGQSVPEVEIFTHVNSEEEIVIKAETDKSGDWAIQLDTASLEEEAFHTAKAYFELEKVTKGVLQSGFSRAVNFYIGEKELADVVSADVNSDGRVNLVDFSIFLLNWGTNDARSDFNQDGVINIADFSIMLFYWTG